MRVDKLLWYLRLAKTRALGHAIAETGHMRRNGQRVERAHQKVAPGDVLVVPLGDAVKVIEILSLPARRGPASEARACYRMLDGAPDLPLAAPPTEDAGNEDLQP